MRAFILITMFCVFSLPCYSQEFKDEEYHTFVNNIFIPAKTIEKENYINLRKLYAKTSFYDPNFPPSNIHKILEKLNTVGISEDQEVHSFEELRLFIRKHMAHIYVHLHMAQFYRNRKDALKEKRHSKVSGFLGLTVLQTGDGLTPETAYRSINKSEEQYIIRHRLNRSYSSISLENIDNQFYSVYQTKAHDTGEMKDIYFNISDYFGKGVTVRALQAQEE